MMMMFNEVAGAKGGTSSKVLVNTDLIEAVRPSGETNSSIEMAHGGQKVTVNMTIDKVLAAIIKGTTDGV